MQATRIDVNELRRGIERDEVVVLDVRQPKAWEGSDVKVPGAIRVEPDALGQAMGQLPKTRQIITYCT